MQLKQFKHGQYEREYGNTFQQVDVRPSLLPRVVELLLPRVDELLLLQPINRQQLINRAHSRAMYDKH